MTFALETVQENLFRRIRTSGERARLHPFVSPFDRHPGLPGREISDSRAQTGAFMVFGFTLITITLKDLVLLGYGNIPSVRHMRRFAGIFSARALFVFRKKKGWRASRDPMFSFAEAPIFPLGKLIPGFIERFPK